MKTRNKIIIFFLFIYIFFAVSLFFIIKWENDKNLVYLKYDIERRLAEVYEDLRRGELKEDGSYHDLKAFVFYDSDFRFVSGIGERPESLDINPDIPRRGIYSFSAKTRDVIYLRRLRNIYFFMGQSPWASHGMGHGRMQRHNPGGYLYVRINASDYWNKLHFIRFIRVFLLVVFAVIMYLLYRISIKNQLYREKIEKQKHLALLGEAARTLTHEIKNPLASIKLQAGLLKKMKDTIDTELIEQIEEEVERLNSLSVKVSDFLKNPKGEPERIDLVDFINKLIKTFLDKNIRFVHNVDKALICFDRHRLRSVVENIITNAFESHGNTEEVLIKINSEKKRIQLSILDRGPGIPAEIQDKIFNAFFTSKIKGSGIGLAISKKFVEASDGEISVHPRLGGGTEVKLVFAKEI